jgi:LacI family transcriptional regulator
MRKVTVSDIAKAAGVSRTTVSYVLNNNANKSISQATRDKILQIAEKLDYIPNPYAVALKTQESKTIAVVIKSISDSYLTEVIRGIQNAIDFNQYSMILHALEVKGRTLQHSIELLCERPIDGIIIAYPDLREGLIIKQYVEKRGIAIVVIGAVYRDLNVRTVYVDTRNAGIQMAEYLYSLGHRHIAVGSNYPTMQRKNRILGVTEYLQPKGFAPYVIDLQQKRSPKKASPKGEFNAGKMFAEKIVTENIPDGVLTMNTYSAFGAIRAFMEMASWCRATTRSNVFEGYYEFVVLQYLEGPRR